MKKVRIVSSKGGSWYSEKIGEEFEVVESRNTKEWPNHFAIYADIQHRKEHNGGAVRMISSGDCTVINATAVAVEIYTCEACGSSGQLNDLHHEEIDGVFTCLECNGGGELSTVAEIEAFEQMAEAKMNPKFDFGEIDMDDI